MREGLEENFCLIAIIGEVLNVSPTQRVDDEPGVPVFEVLSGFSVRAAAKLDPSDDISDFVEGVLAFLECDTAGDLSPMKGDVMQGLEHPVRDALHP